MRLNMKDAVHHLKYVQKKVIREARRNGKETTLETQNGKPVESSIISQRSYHKRRLGANRVS